MVFLLNVMVFGYALMRGLPQAHVSETVPAAASTAPADSSAATSAAAADSTTATPAAAEPGKTP